MKCIKCGEEVSGGKFCPKCGQSLVCPKCGAPRINDFKFCNECGYGFYEAALSDADKPADSSIAADAATTAQSPERDKEAVLLGGGTPSDGLGESAYISNSSDNSSDNSSSAAAVSAGGKKQNFLNSLKSKIGVDNIKKVYRWLPGALALFFGVFLLILLCGSGVKVDVGFLDMKETIGLGYSLMGGDCGAGAAVGSVFILLIALGFLTTGSVRIYFAVKRPFLKFIALDIAQYIMYALAFIMSCVIVGSLNTEYTSTGSAGACLLSFILIGAFFVVGGILLFKLGFMSEVVEEQKAAAAKWKEDRAAHKQAAATDTKTETLTAFREATALTAATVVSSSGEDSSASGENSSASGSVEQKVVTIIQRTGDDYDAQVFTKEKVPGKVKSYRYAPSIIALLYTAAVLILMSLPIATWVDGKGGSLITSIKVFLGKEIGVAGLDSIMMLAAGILLMFFALLSVLRLLKAMGKPYYKMPILSIFQAVGLYAILGMSVTVSTFGMIDEEFASFGNAVACMVIAVLTSIYVFFGAITALCANTDENRFYIKKARKEAFEGKKVKGWQKAVTAVVLLAVFVLTFGLQFVTIGEPGFNKTSAMNIQLGMNTRYELENVLGEGEGNSEYYATYFSKSYRDFMKKVDKAEENFDLAEMEKLEKEYEKLEFKYYAVNYDSNRYVTAFIYNNKASGDEEKQDKKEVKSASLTNNKVEWGYLADKDYYKDNYPRANSRPAVVVEYKDGSVEKTWLDISRYNITDININRDCTGTCKYKYTAAFSEEPVEFSINLINITDCYEVRFNLNGGDGDAPATQLITEFDTLIRPEDPVRAGYVFLYWYHTYQDEPFNFYSDIDSDITLYARWERAYKVSFSLNGVVGIAPSAQYIYLDNHLVRPEDPSCDGYVFFGWYDNPACSGNAYDFSYDPTSDITLFAKWERVYNVSFNLNGAPGTSPVTQNIYPGNPLRQPDEPVYDGYRFAGWYTAASGGELFDFNSEVTDNITLYARWEEIVYVHFDLNGASGSIDSQIINYGALPIRPENPVRSGYVFLGWNTYSDGSGENFGFDYSPEYTLTLYAQWSREVSITFDANGGTGAPSSQTVSAYNAMTYPDIAPTRGGYAFAGWYSYDGELFDFTALPTNDITLYAHWSSAYSNAYGTLAMNSVYDNMYIVSRNSTTRYYAFVAPKTATAYIYTQGSFDTIGYLYDSNKNLLTSDDSSGLDNNFYISYNLTAGNIYYLRVCGYSNSGYTKLIMCDGINVNVEFNLNGSNSGNAPAPQSVARVGGISEPTAPTRSGYTFGGWYSNADCIGNAYDLSKSPCYDITLYAKWIKNVTVTFMDGSSEVTSQTLAAGGLLEYVTRSNYGNYIFAGWYESPSFAGSPYDFGVSPQRDMTLYARYISYDGSGVISANDSMSVTLGNRSGSNKYYYAFVPLKDGRITVYTSSGSIDTYGFLYDGDKSQLAYDDDGGSNNNFSITYNVTAGQLYYIAPCAYSSSNVGNTVTMYLTFTENQ